MKRKYFLYLIIMVTSIMIFSCNYSYEIPEIRNIPAEIEIINYEYIEYSSSESRIDIISGITNAERIFINEKGVCFSRNTQNQPTIDSNTVIFSYINQNEPYLFTRSVFIDSTVENIIIRSYFKSDTDVWYSQPLYINIPDE